MSLLKNIKLPTVEFDEKIYEAPIFERDGQLFCDSECENAFLFSDYYGVYRGGYAWINELLEKWAKDNFNGAYWEWESAGCLALCI